MMLAVHVFKAHDGVVAMSSANGLVGPGFASNPEWVCKRPMDSKATTRSSFSLTSIRVTTNY